MAPSPRLMEWIRFDGQFDLPRRPSVLGWDLHYRDRHGPAVAEPHPCPAHVRRSGELDGLHRPTPEQQTNQLPRGLWLGFDTAPVGSGDSSS